MEMLDFNNGFPFFENIFNRNATSADMIKNSLMDGVHVVFRGMNLYGKTVKSRLLFQNGQENPPAICRCSKSSGEGGFYFCETSEDGLRTRRKLFRNRQIGLPTGKD